jgi:hypothetical protein
MRERYEALVRQPDQIDAMLTEGGARAKAHATRKMEQVRKAIGVA